MDQLHQQIAAGAISQAITTAEHLEFLQALESVSPTSPTTTQAASPPLELYSVLQLLHLIEGDEASARAAAKRAGQATTPSPTTGHSNASSPAVSASAAAAADAEWSAVTSIAQALSAGNSALAHDLMSANGGAWGRMTAPLVATLQRVERERTVALLEAAYGDVAADRAAALLGISDVAEVVRSVVERGWTAEGGGRWLVPPSTEVVEERERARKVAGGGKEALRDGPGLDQLGSLARMVGHLESF